ncbi:MAG: hypothetical protein HOP33_14440 [Verrucomicrobia bacterium]|nr:hypothetical protein [Verrucomicrobiota bacterium]
MNKETQTSLREIINYLYTDEEKHWQAEDRPDRHIFCDIMRLASWLEAFALKSD